MRRAVAQVTGLLPSEGRFTSYLRSPAVAARVGVWLAMSFTVALLTGLLSHWAQADTWWVPYPTGPSWLYRVSQGLHVAAGTAAIPLLLVKLWTVFPKLFQAVPRGRVGEALLHGLERISIGVLVAAAIFELATGLLNTTQWYPWGFAFVPSHYAVAWVAVGALAVHVAVKLPVIRTALTGDVESRAQDHPSRTEHSGLSRRGLLRVTWLSSGVAVVASAGSTLPALRRISVFGVRTGDGPQGVPVNKSAVAAGVTDLARDPGYRLTADVGGVRTSWSLEELRAMPQRTVSLPIACVEGWSADATWTGVPVRQLLDELGVPGDTAVEVTSLQPDGPYTVSTLPGSFADHPDSLLALRLNGEELDLDHGFPCRLIAPNRPGVLQTKWVSRLEVAS